MNASVLRLQRTETTRRAAAAVLLGAEDPTAWLAELAARAPALGKLELYRLPGAGLLAVGAASAHGLAFGWHGRHLLLPLAGELHPPVSPAEADRLFGRWHLVLWHPTLGPCGFDRAEAVSLADLLAPPRDRRPATWNAAQAGTPPPPALASIQLPLPVQSSEIFGDAARQIGNDPIQPPKGAEPPASKSGASSGDNAVSNALRALGGFFGHAGAASGKVGGWLDKLDGWLARQLSAAGAARPRADLDALRQKEIDRLLRELAENPDRGLRHAIPLGSLAGAEARGVAPPSWQLGLRRTDFALDALFASGAADAWSLDAARQSQLRQRYHELARRELQLGRHRRAAYIYAQLLRDLHSAASALLAGGHFREAAVLYLDHLRNPSQAARALVDGGFFEEALPVLASIPDWRGVARVQRLRGDEAAAREALRREAGRLISSHNRIAGAAVLEREVEVPREAAEVLAAAWPFGNDSMECLCELFALHQRQQWVDEARALLARLRVQPLSDAQAVLLCKALCRVYARHQGAPWRTEAADVAVVRIGRQLADASAKDRRVLAECLPKLAGGDRLIGRDVQRYLGFPRQSQAATVKSISRGPWRVEPVYTSRADRKLEVLTAAAWREGFVQLGHNAQGVLEMRVTRWDGSASSLAWPQMRLAGRPQLATSLELDLPLLLLPRAGEHHRPSLQPVPEFPLSAGVPPWLPQDVAAIAYRGGEIVAVRTQPIALSRYSPTGVLAGTTPLPAFDRPEGDELHLAGHPSGHALYASHRQLAIVLGAAVVPQAVIDLEARIVGVRAAFRFARAGFVVSTEHSAQLWWTGLRRTLPVAETRGGGPYLAEFTAGNHLLLVDDLGGQLFDIDLRGEASLRAEFDLPPAVAIAPGQGRDEFAVFHFDGGVSVFRNAR